MPRPCFGTLTAAVVLAVFSPAFAVTYQTVAFSGQHAPGMPDGVTFGSTYTPQGAYQFPLVSLNNAGQVAFKAHMQGGTLPETDCMGAWSGAPGGLSLLARTGEVAPGTDQLFSYITGAGALVINDAGEVAFRGRTYTAGPGSPEVDGFWIYGSSGPRLVMRVGDPAPNAPAGSTFAAASESAIWRTIFNNRGALLVRASLAGTEINDSNDSGVWCFGETGSYRIDNITYPLINNLGQLAGYGPAEGRSGVIFGNSDGWSLVAASGDAAPGAGAGALFSGVGLARPNDNGSVIFRGRVGSVTNGFWIATADSIQAVAIEGQQVPGFPDRTRFSDLQPSYPTPPPINARNQTAFWATAERSTPTEYLHVPTLWLGSPGNLQLIARGDQALPGGLAAPWSANSLDSPVLNASGQVAFTAQGGLWSTNTLGELVPVAVKGQPWEVTPGDTRIMASASYNNWQSSGGQDGLARALNDAGQLAFSLRFEDGTEELVLADLNVLGVTVGILTGENQHGEVVGDPGSAGHVAVTFPRAEAGIFKGWFHSGSPSDVAAEIEPLTEDLLNNLPGAIPANAQVWNLEFTGSALEPADLSLTYDASLLGDTDESSLGVRRLEGGRWWRMASQVDPAADLLHVATDTFGILALSVMGPLLPADLNGDDLIDALDISSFVQALVNPAAYVASRPYAGALSAGDFTGDGLVNALDIAFFVDALTHPASSPVPEPVTGLCLALALACLCSRRHSR